MWALSFSVFKLLNRAASGTGTIFFVVPVIHCLLSFFLARFFGGKVWAGARKCQRVGTTSINDGDTFLAKDEKRQVSMQVGTLCAKA